MILASAVAHRHTDGLRIAGERAPATRRRFYHRDRDITLAAGSPAPALLRDLEDDVEIAVLVLLFLVGTVGGAYQALRYLDRRQQPRPKDHSPPEDH